jgi:VIT1/CCC1 family predicted Fe2+/Mn2+ transporter
MQHTSAGQKAPLTRHLPQEVAYIVALAVALFMVVVTGAVISAALPAQSADWMFGAAYLAPASLAFAAYWWIAQRS